MEKPTWQDCGWPLAVSLQRAGPSAPACSNLNGLEGAPSSAASVGQHGLHGSFGTLSRGPAKPFLDAGPSGMSQSSVPARSTCWAGGDLLRRIRQWCSEQRTGNPLLPSLTCEALRLLCTLTCPTHPSLGWGSPETSGVTLAHLAHPAGQGLAVSCPRGSAEMMSLSALPRVPILNLAEGVVGCSWEPGPSSSHPPALASAPGPPHLRVCAEGPCRGLWSRRGARASGQVLLRLWRPLLAVRPGCSFRRKRPCLEAFVEKLVSTSVE